MKKKLFALFTCFVMMITITLPVFAEGYNEEPERTPGLVSERTIVGQNGETITISLYNLDSNGNLPIPQARAARTLYSGATYLGMDGYNYIVPNATTTSAFKEVITCYNYGNTSDRAGAVTFWLPKSNPAYQAVDAGQAVQFTITTTLNLKISYSVAAIANWYAGQYSVKITAE